MKKSLLIWSVAAMILATGCSSDEDKVVPDSLNPDIPKLESFSLSRGEIEMQPKVLDFNFKLFNHISNNYTKLFGAEADGNFAISPLSATIDMAMVANSFDDFTEEQVCALLGSSDIASLNSLCTKYMQMAAHSGDEFVLANSVWHNEVYNPSPKYTEDMSQIFFADIKPFSENPKSSINEWVSQKTNNNIDAIFGDNMKVLGEIYWLNALYFNGKWQSPFDKNGTRSKTFHGTKGDSQVQMMEKAIDADYLSCNGLEGIRLPFTGSSAMYLLMPEADKEIDDISSLLSASAWESMISTKERFDISVSLPRFAQKSESDMYRIFTSMGLRMSLRAEKMGLSDSFNDFDCKQFNNINVTEEGAEVASTTVFDGLLTSPGVQKRLVFDRPFVYFIVDDSTGAILMAGRICNL